TLRRHAAVICITAALGFAAGCPAQAIPRVPLEEGLDDTVQPAGTIGTTAKYGPKLITAPKGAIILHVGDNISANVKSAPAGSTFFFEAGVYRGVSITPKHGQNFLGAQGAILNGSALLTDFTKEGSLWSVGGQTQEGLRNATDNGDPGAMRAGYPE